MNDAPSLLYFAYGSNMNAGRMMRRGAVSPDQAALRFAVRLPDFRLAFDVWSEARDACAANLHPDPGSEVEGIAYPIDPEAVARLDIAEGHPSWYLRQTVTLLRAADGALIEAIVYLAQPDRLATDPAQHRPTHDYLDNLLAASELLSPAYRDRLLAQPCIGF